MCKILTVTRAGKSLKRVSLGALYILYFPVMLGHCEPNRHWHEVTCSSWHCSTSSFKQGSTAFHCSANWWRQRQGSRHLFPVITNIRFPVAVTCAPWSPVTLFSVHEILIGNKYAFFPNASDEASADMKTWADVIPVGILSVPLPLPLCSRSPESHFSVGLALPFSLFESPAFYSLCLILFLFHPFQNVHVRLILFIKPQNNLDSIRRPSILPPCQVFFFTTGVDKAFCCIHNSLRLNVIWHFQF